MKNILVTGIAGFIGSAVARRLLDQNNTVIGLDNLNDYYDVRFKIYRLLKLNGISDLELNNILSLDNLGTLIKQPKFWANLSFENLSVSHDHNSIKLSGHGGRLKIIIGSIENIETIRQVFNQFNPKIIYNLAARAGVRASLERPDAYVKTNILGTTNILETARHYEVQNFIMSSTSSLYAGQKLPFHEGLKVNTPISPYAATKKSAEMMCYTYHYIYKLSITVLRYFTVYGPSGRPDMSMLRFINWIHNKMPIVLYGDGNQSRDFTYIDDIVDGTIKSSKLEGFNTINLGGGLNPIPIIVIINMISNKLGVKPVILKKPFMETDLLHTKSDNSKAEQLLKWQTKTNIEDGIEASINWYLNNLVWLKKSKF